MACPGVTALYITYQVLPWSGHSLPSGRPADACREPICFAFQRLGRTILHPVKVCVATSNPLNPDWLLMGWTVRPGPDQALQARDGGAHWSFLRAHQDCSMSAVKNS